MRTTSRTLKRTLFVLGLVASLAGGQATANILYTFSGVTFSDGATLTGTFTTNDAINALLDYDLTTSGGSLVGFHYTSGTTVSFSSLPSILVVETAGLEHLLQVTFTGGLTNTGGAITIGDFDSFEQDPTGAHRTIAQGSVVVTTVPEPSVIALAGIGALILLRTLRRQRRS